MTRKRFPHQQKQNTPAFSINNVLSYSRLNYSSWVYGMPSKKPQRPHHASCTTLHVAKNLVNTRSNRHHNTLLSKLLPSSISTVTQENWAFLIMLCRPRCALSTHWVWPVLRVSWSSWPTTRSLPEFSHVRRYHSLTEKAPQFCPEAKIWIKSTLIR